MRDLKALYPHKIVLADAKIADAGKILSRMCFEANADWVTVICCADINTAKGALDVAKEFNGDVQIELTGFWTSGAGAGVARGGYSAGGLSPQPRRAGGRRGVE